MSIQHSLQALRVATAGPFPRTKFLVMFIGVVVGPFVLLVIGGRNPNLEGQPQLAWYFVAILGLLLASLSAGFLMFRRKSQAAKDLSISPGLG